MKVYLCGGINGLSDAECVGWREVAKERLRGHTIIDPMRHDYRRGREDENVYAIVNADERDVYGADALLVNATRPSWGTAMEVKYAADLRARKAIVAFVGDSRVSPWLRYHCTSIVRTVEEAVDVINALIP